MKDNPDDLVTGKARGGGLEPPMAEPESAVLPITPPPKVPLILAVATQVTVHSGSVHPRERATFFASGRSFVGRNSVETVEPGDALILSQNGHRAEERWSNGSTGDGETNGCLKLAEAGGKAGCNIA